MFVPGAILIIDERGLVETLREIAVLFLDRLVGGVRVHAAVEAVDVTVLDGRFSFVIAYFCLIAFLYFGGVGIGECKRFPSFPMRDFRQTDLPNVLHLNGFTSYDLPHQISQSLLVMPTAKIVQTHS